jgi:hypothetical protein
MEAIKEQKCEMGMLNMLRDFEASGASYLLHDERKVEGN